MKKQLLFLSLAAAALLAGCSKNEIGIPDAPATHISAKATGAKSPTTKAPQTGTSMNGQRAQVFATTSPLNAYTGDKTKMFTDAYAHGRMTFVDNTYVQYDQTSLNGKILLPQDKSPLFLYGFYPMGWTLASTGAYESLSRTFEGKSDVMVTYLSVDDQQQIAYGGGTSGTLPDKAEFMFRHLLTCFSIYMKAADDIQLAAWGRVKSVKFKDATVDKISTDENLGYTYSASGGAVSFYKITGSTTAPYYEDEPLEKTKFDDMRSLSTTERPICYAMAAPVTVDDSALTPELTLIVTTLDKEGGTEITTEVPVSLDQTKFAANGNSTRGYSVNISLVFSGNSINPTASVGEWAAGNTYDQDVDPVIGVGAQMKGGIVFWVDPNNPKHYKVVSVTEAPTVLAWAANRNYQIGSGARSNTDGKANTTAIKAAFDNKLAGVAITEATFEEAFPAAAWCYNYQGADGTDAVGTWYFPAVNELQYLWCAFNDKAPINWDEGITSPDAPVDADAQKVFNKYLTDAGGTVLTTNASSAYITSTEHDQGDYAKAVKFSTGLASGLGKNSGWSVRCIKSL